jgi:hypothetical protein
MSFRLNTAPSRRLRGTEINAFLNSELAEENDHVIPAKVENFHITEESRCTQQAIMTSHEKINLYPSRKSNQGRSA